MPPGLSSAALTRDSGRPPYAVRMAAAEPWKYERIAAELRARIRSGEYPPGARLPSKSALKARHGVSDAPVVEALRVLRGEGLTEARQGSGVFVRDPLPDAPVSEYETLMGRVDALTDEVRRLRREFDALRRERGAT